MKIAMVITGLGTGGAELSLVNLVTELRNRHEVRVLSIGPCGPVASRLERVGVPVKSLGVTSALSLGPGFLRLLRELRAFRPDVVHTWMYHSDLVGGIAARLLGIRSVFWSLHCSDLSPERIRPTTRWVARVCSWLAGAVPSGILSCSSLAAKVHADLGYPRGKMRVIPNGFDLAQFRPDLAARADVRQELGVPADAALVGLVARRDPCKNHIGFVRAAQVTARAVPGAHFLLAGAGIDESHRELLQALERSGLRSRFHLLGERHDVPRLMAALDVLVSASDVEAFPMVLGEAMSCGVPCVVTDVGDCAEIVGDTGRVVQASDMEALGRSTAELLALPEGVRRDLAHRARERVLHNYAIEAVAGEYETAYAHVAAG